MARIALVIPCYNEEDVLRQTYARLQALLPTIAHEMAIIFVDDGSRDNTLGILREICAADVRCHAITFSRNFGHQAALCAGLDYAGDADAIIMMDADLQDPPELITQLIAKWEEGYDVVYTRRLARESETLFKRVSAHLYYRVFNCLSQFEMPRDAADFRLIDQRVAAQLRAMPEKDRFLRGMIAWVGFRQAEVTYHRYKRAAGATHYSLRKMLRLAADGIVSFSTAPLHLALWLGGFTLFAAVAGGIAVACEWDVIAPENHAATLIVLAVAFFSGVQLLCLGIIGEYIGRMYQQGKDRPLYIVRETVGL